MSEQGPKVAASSPAEGGDAAVEDGARDEAFVRLAGVSKSYDGETRAVGDLDLDAARGEFLTLLGPSGAGKTTCLAMLAGFEPATDGEIVVGGLRVNDVPPHRRGVGVVLHGLALFPHLSVAENVAFPLRMRRLARAEIGQKTRAAMAMLRLDPDLHAGRRPGELSAEQSLRAALARALAFEPELVLMDEPLGELDEHLRPQMREEIRHLQARRRFTLIYATQNQSDALTLSHRIAVLNEGRVEQIGTPADIYERPQNSFVAQFVGENNRLPGVVEFLKDGYARVRLADGAGIAAVAANVSEIGQPTVIAVRPERVELSPQGAAAQNTLTAEVREATYHGDFLRVRMSLAGYDAFIVKLRNGVATPRLQPGQKVKIGWSAEDCRALDPPTI